MRISINSNSVRAAQRFTSVTQTNARSKSSVQRYDLKMHELILLL